MSRKEFQSINLWYQKMRKKYDHLFSKINFDRKKLANYKYKNIKIGDLIYDTYLRIYYVPTIKINDIN